MLSYSSNLTHMSLLATGKSGSSDYLCPMDIEPIDAKAEDKRIKDAVAQYKKELAKNNKQDVIKVRQRSWSNCDSDD